LRGDVPDHEIKQGDCILSIAYRYGVGPEKIWNHPKNEDLKSLRKDPNVLYPGDKVFVPEREKFICATGKRHVFRKIEIPMRLRFRFSVYGEPLADQPYKMMSGNDVISEGKLDSDGFLEATIHPKIDSVVVKIGEPDEEIIYELDVGNTDPVTELSGVQQRLINLGFYCIEEDELRESTRDAIRAFQKDQNLSVTGEPDQATQDALVKEHGL
jgi:N-acetylmuramoyl-L-alanine amidase